MIAIEALFVLLAVVVYLCTPGLPMPPRLLVAFLAFAIPTIVSIAILAFAGDRPGPCSQAYDPQTKELGPPEDCDPPPEWWTPEWEIEKWDACRRSADTCIPSAEWDARIEELMKRTK
jgi:hypothetical protein